MCVYVCTYNCIVEFGIWSNLYAIASYFLKLYFYFMAVVGAVDVVIVVVVVVVTCHSIMCL